jgi:hypothetical protein
VSSWWLTLQFHERILSYTRLQGIELVADIAVTRADAGFSSQCRSKYPSEAGLTLCLALYYIHTWPAHARETRGHVLNRGWGGYRTGHPVTGARRFCQPATPSRTPLPSLWRPACQLQERKLEVQGENDIGIRNAQHMTAEQIASSAQPRRR